MAILRKLDRWMTAIAGPVWLRLTRERAIHERFGYAVTIMNELGVTNPKILDVGCGSGLLLYYMRKLTHGISDYTGIDLYASRLTPRYASIKVPHVFHEINLDTDWTMPPCDIAWSSEVLEHLIDDQGVFKRIVASVKPGGYIIVTMPSLSFLQRLSHKFPDATKTSATQDGGHVRAGYTPDMIARMADDAGVEILQIDGISPRTDFEFKTRFYGGRLSRMLVDPFSMSRRPSPGTGIKPDDLQWYHSIAAVMKKPA